MSFGAEGQRSSWLFNQASRAYTLWLQLPSENVGCLLRMWLEPQGLEGDPKRRQPKAQRSVKWC